MTESISDDVEMLDEDVFRRDLLNYAVEHEYVNYQVNPTFTDDGVIVELFTGDLFKVTIEQVWEENDD